MFVNSLAIPRKANTVFLVLVATLVCAQAASLSTTKELINGVETVFDMDDTVTVWNPSSETRSQLDNNAHVKNIISIVCGVVCVLMLLIYLYISKPYIKRLSHSAVEYASLLIPSIPTVISFLFLASYILEDTRGIMLYAISLFNAIVIFCLYIIIYASVSYSQENKSYSNHATIILAAETSIDALREGKFKFPSNALESSALKKYRDRKLVGTAWCTAMYLLFCWIQPLVSLSKILQIMLTVLQLVCIAAACYFLPAIVQRFESSKESYILKQVTLVLIFWGVIPLQHVLLQIPKLLEASWSPKLSALKLPEQYQGWELCFVTLEMLIMSLFMIRYFRSSILYDKILHRHSEVARHIGTEYRGPSQPGKHTEGQNSASTGNGTADASSGDTIVTKAKKLKQAKTPTKKIKNNPFEPDDKSTTDQQDPSYASITHRNTRDTSKFTNTSKSPNTSKYAPDD